MRNQEMFGKMRPAQITPTHIDIVQVPCSKCLALFDIKKMHYEIFEAETLYVINDTGFLAASSANHGYYRLCSGCQIRLRAWFNER